MSALARMRSLAISETSPDGSITIAVSGSAGFSVAVAPGALRHRRAAELAEQIGAAINAALDRYRTLVDRSRPVARTAADPRYDRIRRAVSEYTEVIQSPRAWVRLRWRGNGRIDVKVRPAVMTTVGVSEAAMAGDIRAALTEAAGIYNRHIMRAVELAGSSGGR